VVFSTVPAFRWENNLQMYCCHSGLRSPSLSGACLLSPLVFPQSCMDFLSEVGWLFCRSRLCSRIRRYLLGVFRQKSSFCLGLHLSQTERLTPAGERDRVRGNLWGEERPQNCGASLAVVTCSSLDETSDFKRFLKNCRTSCFKRWQITQIYFFF